MLIPASRRVAAPARMLEEPMTVYDLWLVAVVVALFVVNVLFAVGCDRLMGRKP